MIEDLGAKHAGRGRSDANGNSSQPDNQLSLNISITGTTRDSVLLESIGDRLGVFVRARPGPNGLVAESIRLDRYFPNGELRDYCEIKALPVDLGANLAHAISSGAKTHELAEILSNAADMLANCMEYHLAPERSNFCIDNGHGLITYSCLPELDLKSFLTGANEVRVELVQEQRGIAYEPGHAELTLSLEEIGEGVSQLKMCIKPNNETKEWTRELICSGHSALSKYADKLISDFITQGALMTIVKSEMRYSHLMAQNSWSHLTERGTEIAVHQGEGWQTVFIFGSKGGSLLLHFQKETDGEKLGLNCIGTLRTLETERRVVKWGYIRDSVDRAFWQYFEMKADEVYAVLPKGGYPWCDFLAKAAADVSIQVVKPPRKDLSYRLIQGIGRTVLKVADRAPHEVSIMEVGLADDLRGYIRLANRLGAEDYYYFQGVIPATIGEAKRRKHLEHFVALLASSPTKLCEVLGTKYEKGRSSLPSGLDTDQEKAYAEVGRLILLAEEDLLLWPSGYGEGGCAVWPVTPDGRFFKIILLERLDLRVETWVGPQGIERIKAISPARSFLRKMLGKSTELSFEISAPSPSKSNAILQVIAAIPPDKDANDFLRAELGMYLD